jgi:hypothetical protein
MDNPALQKERKVKIHLKFTHNERIPRVIYDCQIFLNYTRPGSK